MNYRAEFMRVVAALICVLPIGSSAAQQAAARSETVMVTLHAIPGVETELQRVIAGHWTTARQLQLGGLGFPIVFGSGDFLFARAGFQFLQHGSAFGSGGG